MRMGLIISLVIITALSSRCNSTLLENEFQPTNLQVSINGRDSFSAVQGSLCDSIEDSGFTLMIHNKLNLDSEYQPYHIILDPESVSNAHLILNGDEWNPIKSNESSPADYRIYFQPTNDPQTVEVFYDVWLTKGYVERHIQGLQSYTKLSATHVEDLRTIIIQKHSSAKEYTTFLAMILPSRATAAEADMEIMELEEFYRIDLRNTSTIFLSERNISAYRNLINPISLEDVMKMTDDHAKKLAIDAIEGKYKLIEGEGVVVPIVDYRSLLDYSTYLSPGMVAYLELKAIESDNPMIADGSIVIEWSQIANRALSIEAYLKEYPESPRYDQLSLDLRSYLFSFFIGSSNTDIFESDRTIKPIVRTAYDHIIASHSDTKTGILTQEYTALLERLIDEYPTVSNVFNDPMQQEIHTFIEALDERINLIEVN